MYWEGRCCIQMKKTILSYWNISPQDRQHTQTHQSPQSESHTSRPCTGWARRPRRGSSFLLGMWCKFQGLSQYSQLDICLLYKSDMWCKFQWMSQCSQLDIGLLNKFDMQYKFHGMSQHSQIYKNLLHKADIGHNN